MKHRNLHINLHKSILFLTTVMTEHGIGHNNRNYYKQMMKNKDFRIYLFCKILQNYTKDRTLNSLLRLTILLAQNIIVEME